MHENRTWREEVKVSFLPIAIKSYITWPSIEIFTQKTSSSKECSYHERVKMTYHRFHRSSTRKLHSVLFFQWKSRSVFFHHFPMDFSFVSLWLLSNVSCLGWPLIGPSKYKRRKRSWTPFPFLRSSLLSHRSNFMRIMVLFNEMMNKSCNNSPW